MIAEIEERRLGSRIAIDGRILYHLEGSKELHQAELGDMSRNGAMIWLPQNVPLNSRLFCRIDSDVQGLGAIEFTVIVLRNHSKQKNSLFGYGCTIEEIDSMD